MNILQNFSKWCFSKSALPYWCILVYDSVTVIASGFFVYYLQHGLSDLIKHLSQVSIGIGICLAIYMVAFMLFHTFNGVLRFSSFIDLRRVAILHLQQVFLYVCSIKYRYIVD